MRRRWVPTRGHSVPPRVVASDDGEAGFTLIELLIVMLVIGILVAIAIPLFLAQRDKGYEASMKADLTHVETAVATIQVDAPGTVTLSSSLGALTVSDGVHTEAVKLSTGNALHDQSGDFSGGGWCVSLENPQTAAVWNITSANGAQRLLRGPCTSA